MMLPAQTGSRGGSRPINSPARHPVRTLPRLPGDFAIGVALFRWVGNALVLPWDPGV